MRAVSILVLAFAACGGASAGGAGPARAGGGGGGGGGEGPPEAERDYPYAAAEISPVVAHFSDVVLALLEGDEPPATPIRIMSGRRAPQLQLVAIAAGMDFTFTMPTPSNPDRVVHLSLMANAAGVKVMHAGEATRARTLQPGLPAWLAGAETEARLQLEVIRSGADRSLFLGPDDAEALAGDDPGLRQSLEQAFAERYAHPELVDDVLRGADEPQGMTVESFHLWGFRGDTLYHLTFPLSIEEGKVVLDPDVEPLRVPADLPF